MNSRIGLIVAIAVAVSVAIALIASGRRRRANEHDLSKHPERLDQMLDPTDDA